MAVVNHLPNGYIMVTLSPREGVMLCDEILDPGDFPWQGSESQMIAMEVKSAIRATIDTIHAQQMNMLKGMIPAPGTPAPEPEQPPEPEHDDS